MQKIATRIFIVASILFGIVGILMVVTMPAGTQTASGLNDALSKILMATIFIILPSFAVSVAGKYLKK